MKLRETVLLIANYLSFLLLSVLLVSAQGSLWLHVFGYSSAPYIWLAVINYWVLYRNLPEALIMCYVTTFTFYAASGIPLEMAFAVSLSLFVLISLLKDRVLWSGPNSFMLSCCLSAAALPIFTLAWSIALEPRSISHFYFFEWIIRSLLTAATALPLFYLFNFIDKITQKEHPKTSEAGFL